MAASLGQWMQSTALGWIALDLTDSTSFVGWVAFMASIPFLFISPPAGVLIDRYDARKILIFCQVAMAIIACGVAVDVISGHISPAHLLVAALINGVLQAVLSPTQQAVSPRLVPRESLTNAVGLVIAGQSMTRVVGPSVAGVLIGFAGSGSAFIAQAIAALAAFVLIFLTPIPAATRGIAVVRLRNMVEGLRFVAGRTDLRTLFLMASIPFLLAFPYSQFLSVFARDVLDIGATGLGILMASSGVGAVIGSLFIAGGSQRRGLGKIIAVTTIIYGVLMILVSISRNPWISAPLIATASGLGTYYAGANNAMLQHRLTDEMRGRVLGGFMLTSGLMPLGTVTMGIFAGSTSAPIATAVFGVLTIASMAVLAGTSKTLRSL
jgi:MFS family permease